MSVCRWSSSGGQLFARLSRGLPPMLLSVSLPFFLSPREWQRILMQRRMVMRVRECVCMLGEECGSDCLLVKDQQTRTEVTAQRF